MIKPFNNNLVVRPDPEGIKSDIIDTSAQDKTYDQTSGVLVAVGSEAFKGWGHTPSVGDRVFFVKYKGALLPDREHRIIPDNLLLGGEYD